MTFRHLLPLLLLPWIALPACDGVDEDGDLAASPEGEDPEFRGWGHGSSGPVLNTFVQNGSAIGMLRVGLPTSLGTQVSAIYSTVNGDAVDLSTVEVVDGALKGKTAGGVDMDAFDFTNSLWVLETPSGASLGIISDVQYAVDAGLANKGAKMMTNVDPERIVYKWTTPDAPAAGTKLDPKTGWGGAYDGTHACAPDAQGDTWAVFYRGMNVEADGDVVSMYYANQYFYAACLSGRIGKAAMWGYAPDNPSPNIPDLTFAEFEGAHRMVGAEYCGDGRSYTRVGEAVTLKDKWVLNQFYQSTLGDEAVWAIDRALCVTTPRWTLYSSPLVCANGTVIYPCNQAPYGSAASAFNGATAKWWTKNASF